MAHVKHFKKTDIKRLSNEYDRDEKYMSSHKDDENISRIDLNRVNDDYVLSQNPMSPKQSLDEYKKYTRGLDNKIKSRLSDSDLRVSNRKDLNVMSVWVVTVPEELKGNKDQEDRFLQLVYDFTVERYGKNNVMDGFVHKDETSSHIHIPLVPVKDGRVSSKALFTKSELSNYHKELDKVMINEFKIKGLVLNGRTKGNYTVEELKERTRRENDLLRREEAVESKEVLQKRINALEGRITRLEDYAKQFNQPKYTKAVNETKNHVKEVMAAAERIEERERDNNTHFSL